MRHNPLSLPDLIDQHIRPDVLSMHAYPVQDSVGLLKLDAMENPHRLSGALQAQLGQRLGALALNRYPSSRIDDLRRALTQHARLPAGFDLMLGNGSDELISLLAMACDVPGACVLAPVPGFVMYALSAQLQGLKFVGVPLDNHFELDEAAMLHAIATHQRKSRGVGGGFRTRRFFGGFFNQNGSLGARAAVGETACAA